MQIVQNRRSFIPLTQRARAVLSLWLDRFRPSHDPGKYVFPKHQVGFAGDDRKPYVYHIDFSRPMDNWRSAWTRARYMAGLNFRWHDLRHTFVSRLAENPAISEQTITALAGHVSKRMLERYSHIRTQAKRAAIESLETGEIPGPWVQKWAHSSTVATSATTVESKKLLN
jgi:integrase